MSTMHVTVVNETRKSSLVEAPDGRRFIISGKKEVTVRPEGSDTPIVSGKGLSFKAARRLLEIELSNQKDKDLAA
jgi:hypothetical protein